MVSSIIKYCHMKMTDDDKSFFKTLGERFTELRKAKNMTQGHLAELLGISQQHTASFEKGLRKIPVSMLPKLSQLYGISLDELIGIEYKETKRGPMPKLQRQINQVALLPKNKQKFVSEMLDTVIYKEGK